MIQSRSLAEETHLDIEKFLLIDEIEKQLSYLQKSSCTFFGKPVNQLVSNCCTVADEWLWKVVFRQPYL